MNGFKQFMQEFGMLCLFILFLTTMMLAFGYVVINVTSGW
jgi:hypothetical protein